MTDLVVNTAPTAHRKWLPYLDGWRGLAVIAVVFGHFWRPSFFPMASFGVELFFVLSGRLMAGILFIEQYPLRDFFVRRTTRVWPALYIFIASAAIIWRHVPALGIETAHLLGSLFFVSNYVSVRIGESIGLNHLWSLAVEEWTYVALAAMAFLCRRYRWSPFFLLWSVTALCAALGIWRWWQGGTLMSVYWNPEVRAASITLGSLAYLHLKDRLVPRWLPLAAGAVGIALHVSGVAFPIRYTLGTAGLAIAVASIDGSYGWIRDALLSNRLVRQIGLWSFSIYLWQQPISDLMRDPEWLRPVGVLLCVAIGAASYIWIEKPTRNYLNLRWERWQRRISPAPQNQSLESRD